MFLQFTFHIFALITLLGFSLLPSYSQTLDAIIAQPGCDSTCGDVSIPYPFGMEDPKCYLDDWFEIECRNNRPYLKSLNLEVTYLDYGYIWIINPIFYWHCDGKYNNSVIIDQKGSPFVYSQSNITYIKVALGWEIPNEVMSNNSNCYNSSVTSSSQNKTSGWTCQCKEGFYGNPYIHGSCIFWKPKSHSHSKKWAIEGVSSSLGSVILLFGLWCSYRVLMKRVTKNRKEKFFKRNGGLLLQQRLSSAEVSVHKILFPLKDIERATDNFNVNRVLGKGGQGTVYKGMLVDGKIVAVKKFKVQGNIDEFINEFAVLSQINHRHVVKLLGCCLETEIPLLVYEFIPNGNLFEYLHVENEELPVTWDIRLRIAKEIAGALFYLQSLLMLCPFLDQIVDDFSYKVLSSQKQN